MARIVVRGAEIVVCLSWWEKVLTRSREVRVPLSALRRVYVQPDWWRALRGTCGRGTWIPARRCTGVRHVGQLKDFVVVRPGGPVLCVELGASAPFSRLAVSDPDPHEALSALEPHLPDSLLSG
ncbi:hypothetical protein ACF059_13220 [Streptomyces sp. NPDC016562]|uniref:hypothetical protein n=1 Tax=Streptomyces sp. NPDC016562 TaxID=3364966 RepID=UPI0036FA94E3